MKAILEFELPEDRDDHAFALAGLDALLLIDDITNEIRSYLKHGGGEYLQFNAEVYNEAEDKYETKRMDACPYTLERVAQLIFEAKEERKLPELV